MWELISNGINVAGSLASVGSFLSSYSIDRDKKKVEKSILNIEKNLLEYNKLLSDIGKPKHLEQYLANLLDSKRQNEIRSSQILEALHSNSKYQKRLISSLSELLDEIRGAYTLQKTEYQQAGRNLYNTLIQNPFNAGISQFWDISDLSTFEGFPNKIMSNINTPVLWRNPQIGRRFVGEMHNANLHHFGINTKPPHYKFNESGFVYDDKRGLYLPHISKLI